AAAVVVLPTPPEPQHTIIWVSGFDSSASESSRMSSCRDVLDTADVTGPPDQRAFRRIHTAGPRPLPHRRAAARLPGARPRRQARAVVPAGLAAARGRGRPARVAVPRTRRGRWRRAWRPTPPGRSVIPRPAMSPG